MSVAELPVQFTDPVNARILEQSEDRIQGFQRDPLGAIAKQSGVELETVIERIRAMLRAGTIRRVRQTLLATNLAQGALVAWEVSENLDAAFDYMFQQDPFSGHVVTRSTDTASAGSTYKLWTTLKVPQGYSMTKHCEFLARKTGAGHFRMMPAKRLFALGVGHTRRRGMPPGSKAEVPAEPTVVSIAKLNDLEWRILVALKREFGPEEIVPDIWRARAAEARRRYEAALQAQREIDWARYGEEMRRLGELLERLRASSAGPE
jgi:DNA-binding Lrp family transcriptional regulator